MLPTSRMSAAPDVDAWRRAAELARVHAAADIRGGDRGSPVGQASHRWAGSSSSAWESYVVTVRRRDLRVRAARVRGCSLPCYLDQLSSVRQTSAHVVDHLGDRSRHDGSLKPTLKPRQIPLALDLPSDRVRHRDPPHAQHS